jgi:hypothetical protein
MQGIQNLRLDLPSSPISSDGASTPRGNTDTSDADESESGAEDNIRESIGDGKQRAAKAPSSREKAAPVRAASVETAPAL